MSQGWADSSLGAGGLVLRFRQLAHDVQEDVHCSRRQLRHGARAWQKRTELAIQSIENFDLALTHDEHGVPRPHQNE